MGVKGKDSFANTQHFQGIQKAAFLSDRLTADISNDFEFDLM